MSACNLCGCESPTDPCDRCASETHWAGSDRASYSRGITPVWSTGPASAESGSDRILGRMAHTLAGVESDPERRAKRTAKIRASINDALTNLPDAYALLALFMLPGSAPVDPDRRSATSSPAKPPARLEVIDLLDVREKADSEPTRTDYDLDRRAGARRQGILPTLVSWSRLVSSELWDECVEHAEPSDPPTVATECSWLLPHLSWIMAQQWADEMADDLGTMLSDIRKATGAKPEGRVLPCPKCGWDLQGEGDYDEERSRFPWYACTGCDNTITTQAELDRADNQARDSVTLRYAAEQLGKSLSGLKDWQKRGWISPLGRDSRGQVYSMKALRRVAESVTKGKRYERVSTLG